MERTSTWEHKLCSNISFADGGMRIVQRNKRIRPPVFVPVIEAPKNKDRRTEDPGQEIRGRMWIGSQEREKVGQESLVYENNGVGTWNMESM
jgi:hypothetical protein